MNRLSNFMLVAMVIVCCCGTQLHAQLPSGWKAHDFERPRPEVVVPGESNLPLKPPADAVILFDGKDLSEFRDADGQEPKWIVKEGVLESVPGSGYLFTAKTFGDCQLHVEWSAPAKVEGKSQGRGNSGVLLMGRYEIQVLDSFENVTYADGQAGSLYGQYPPLVNVCRKPGEWQSYDIVFRRPRFEEGTMVKPARFTVFHNGVLIQDNIEAWGPTSWIQHLPPDPHADRLPLSFQDHGNPVRYRNIWLRELTEQSPAGPGKPYDAREIKLTSEQMDVLVGKYGMFEMKRDGNGLKLLMVGREFAVIAHAENEFSLPFTAATITFKKNNAGKPTSLEFRMGGETMRGERK
jgi:Domain of Unknown Function (DUF1080)